VKISFIEEQTELTTAATDLVLGMMAVVAVVYLRRIEQSDSWKTNIWSWVFGLMAVSGFLGAVAHGFKMSASVNNMMWQPLNLTLGLTVALFAAGVVYDQWGGQVTTYALPCLILTGLVFYGITLMFPGSFGVFVAYEMAAMLFALCVYGWLSINGKLDGAWLMTLGILVTIIAAVVQTRETLSFRLVWQFDHNGLFHIIQMAGMALLVAGLRASLNQPQQLP
jgi:hypothetical protein